MMLLWRGIPLGILLRRTAAVCRTCLGTECRMGGNGYSFSAICCSKANTFCPDSEDSNSVSISMLAKALPE